MRITKKLAGTVAVSAVVALGAGTAFAYWTTGGSGDGTAAVGTTTNFTIAGDITDALVLDAVESFDITVTNPATFPQRLSGLSWDFQPTNAGCNKAWFDVTPATVTAQDIAGGASVTFSGASLKLRNEAATNQDACKNSAIELTFTSN
ncbi:hypothetical protein [Sporichthya polymorpha]|uniref:hypothetical protein n=1 Tax=Sporichthya polymorpha TaxID=35751 RepID=UPI00037013A0|nr:hypothetical protein [Sporichthya polymorpha]